MLTLLLSSTLYAHSGGTDSSGGHGGSQPYHYHGGGGGGYSGGGYIVSRSFFVNNPDKAPTVQAGGEAWTWPFMYKEEASGYCSAPRENQRCYPVYEGTRDQNIITCWMINAKTDQPVYCNFYLTDIPKKLAYFTPSSRDDGDVGSKVYKVRTLKVDLKGIARKQFEAKMAAQREHERLQREREQLQREREEAERKAAEEAAAAEEQRRLKEEAEKARIKKESKAREPEVIIVLVAAVAIFAKLISISGGI